MQNKASIIGTLVVVVLIIGGAWYFTHPGGFSSTPSTATSTAPLSDYTNATTTTISGSGNGTVTALPTGSGAVTPVAPKTLTISSKDSITSWNFVGAYSNNTSLTSQAKAQIANSQSKLGAGGSADQALYVNIGQQYMFLGDGKDAYNSFTSALQVKSPDLSQSALAYANLGDLMAKLGAKYTAATAYADAVAALPGEPSFHVARISFLIDSLPKETALINAAFADAAKDVPNDPSVAQLKAQYQASQSSH